MSESTDGSRERVVSGVRFVPAPPDTIFDLLADPTAHVLFDGSGTVKASTGDNPTRLTLGARFGMKMRMGVPYRITNEVVEFDEPTLIAWRHLGGHVWRYRLRSVDGGTEVTEEFDWSPSKVPWLLEVFGIPKRNAAAIEATLDRLVQHVS